MEATEKGHERKVSITPSRICIIKHAPPKKIRYKKQHHNMIIAMAICNVNCKLYKHNSSIHILKTDAFVIYTQNPGKTDRVS
jgi:hypothetical protein